VATSAYPPRMSGCSGDREAPPGHQRSSLRTTHAALAASCPPCRQAVLDHLEIPTRGPRQGAGAHPSRRSRVTARRPRTPSVSHTARARRYCIPSGVASPACPAIDQQFFRGKSANNPSTNARTRRRGSTRPNRPATHPRSSSNIACHRPGSTLWPAATARSSEVDTTGDDHAVAALRPGLTRCKITIYGCSTTAVVAVRRRLGPPSRVVGVVPSLR
jgi:hypothetical protein